MKERLKRDYSQKELNDAMYSAIREDSVVGVEVLLAAGADVQDLSAHNKETTLHCAAFHGAWEVCKFLVELGIDVNARNASGNTPLFEACSRNKPHCSMVLVSLGASTSDWTHDIDLYPYLKCGSMKFAGMTRRESAILMNDPDLFREIQKTTEPQGAKDEPKALIKFAAKANCANFTAYIQADAAMRAVDSAMKTAAVNRPA